MVETRFLWKRAYIITEPDAIADVLVEHPKSFIKPYVLRRLKVLFGDGLLTSDGDVWRSHRLLSQPAFSAERMPLFVHVVRRNAEAMVATWRNGEVRDVYSDLVELCMKNVAQTMFGAYDEELAEIVRALAGTCHQLVHGVFDVIRPWPFRFRRQLREQVESQLDALDRYLGRLIDHRKTVSPRCDFLELLLSGSASTEPLSRQAILDEAVTMLLAGHETTTSAVVWALYLLARHPQIADALAENLTHTLHGDAPSHAELDQLECLRTVLDETLRLYPPTHRIARTVVAPVVVGGRPLSADVDVIMPQWAVHRSPRWYQEPESFVPSRWTPSFRRSLPRFAFFPFSGGARTCIGGQLAWCESAAILALLTQRFRFSLCDDAPLVPQEGLTLLPGSGQLRVRLERRHTERSRSSAMQQGYASAAPLTAVERVW